VPDKEFMEKLPADARYEVSQITVKVQRGLGAPKTILNQAGSGKDARVGVSLSLGVSLQDDPAGTKIYVEVDKIQRVNFKNQKVEEAFGMTEKIIGAVIN
jgi:hypothetical protein